MNLNKKSQNNTKTKENPEFYTKQLKKFETVLTSSQNILTLCLHQLEIDEFVPENKQEDAKKAIQELLAQITQDIQKITQLNLSLNKKFNAQLHKDQFQTIQLKFNKFLISVEKIYTLSPNFKRFLDQSPGEQGLLEQSLKPESTQTAQKATIEQILYPSLTFQDQMPKIQGNDASLLKPKENEVEDVDFDDKQTIISALSQQSSIKTAGKLGKLANLTNIDFDSKEFIKKEILEAKQILQEVQMLQETHDHTYYEQEIERIKLENNRLFSDYKLVKQENTEMMHQINELKATLAEIGKQNSHFIEQIAKVQHHQEQTNSKILINPTPQTRLPANTYQSDEVILIQDQNQYKNKSQLEDYSQIKEIYAQTTQDFFSKRETFEQELSPQLKKFYSKTTRTDSPPQAILLDEKNTKKRNLIPQQSQELDISQLSVWAQLRIQQSQG